MKTIQTTMKYMVCLTLLLAVKQFASADIGPGNGGGNGGNGFLMQEMKAANPGLSPQEIILKAFNDSEGRVPKLLKKLEGDIFSYFAFSYKGFTGFEHTSALHIENSNYMYKTEEPGFKCSKPEDLGPLLTKKTTECELKKVGKIELFQNIIAISETGLVVLESINDQNKRTILEFRQLSKNEIVYLIYPNFLNADRTKFLCKSMDSHNNIPFEPTNGICGVGYIWY